MNLPSFSPRIFALAVLASLIVRPALGQAPPPTPANPQAPTLNPVVPLGMQRGTSLELILTGSNLAEPTGFWTSFPAAVTIPTDKNNGKDNGSLRVHLDVPKDAPIGFHHVRLGTTRGISNVRLFCIDDLPQVMETDTNRSRDHAQAVPVPCVVVGRADAEVSDYFKIHVLAGQRVSFEILGRRLGSLLDPQLTLLDGRTGRELPGGHSNDAPGLQTDSRLTYTFKQSGDYLLEVRDVMYRGGPDFWYRLRIGDFPCASTALPMAARRGSQMQIQFAGPQVEGVAPLEVAVPADPGSTSIALVPRGSNGLPGWPVTLAITDHEELLEQEPNNDPGHANRLPVPGGITGRFLESGDIDHFTFAARKGQRYVIEAQTHELHSPAEVYLSLKDAKGNALAASNPAAGARIDYTAPADGDLIIAVEHLLYWHGPAETYHLTVTPYRPGFDLLLGTDRLDVHPGSSSALPIYVARRDFTGPIDVALAGPPGVSGYAHIPAGQPPAPNQPAATLFVTAAADVQPGPYTASLLASATVNGQWEVRPVELKAIASQSLAGLTYPPRALFHEVAVGVIERPPFTLSARLEVAEAAQAVAFPVTITAQRTAGFQEPVTLTPVGLPPNVAASLKNPGKGETRVQGTITPAANAPLGKFTISFTGKAKVGNKEFTVTAAPVELVIAPPIAVQVEPATATLPPGGKARLKIVATRQGGYAGPITLDWKDLPPGVTATKATLAPTHSAADLELTAAPTAAPTTKPDARLIATATGAGNVQVLSAPVSITITKK